MQDVSSLTVEWESSAAKQSSSVCVVYWLGSHFTIMPLMKFLFLNHDVISWSCFICGLFMFESIISFSVAWIKCGTFPCHGMFFGYAVRICYFTV